MSEAANSKKQQELDSKQSRDDIYALMQLPVFRRYIRRQLAGCEMHRRGYIGSSELYYKAGVRDVGLKIESEIRAHCFDLWIQMLQEANAK